MFKLAAIGIALLYHASIVIGADDTNAGTKPTVDSKPNVVIFLADDQGYGDLSFTGNRDLATPNIDSLARDGAVVENFFVCPVCSPTRSEFFTGRYHPRSNVYATSAGGERMDLDETTFAQAFKAAGYTTAAFGKWHNGSQPPYHPNARGFDEFYGFCSGHWGHYFSPMLEHNGEIVTGNGYLTDDLTDRALQFIESNQRKPFLVYLPYNTPHSPMQVPDEHWSSFADKPITQPSTNRAGEKIDHTRAALAMVENIDVNVGRVLAKLNELQLADNTIVIYFSDNGPNGWRFNGGFKGSKGSTDEGGVRSPLLVRWPKEIPAGTRVKPIAGAIDLYPTLSDLCGLPEIEHLPFDGVSIALELQGAKVKRQPRMIFSHWNNRVSVRTDVYRLDSNGKLFDMLGDPGQTKVVTDQPEVATRLQQAVQQWRETVLAELVRETVAFPVGHADFRRTQLPARDATATGQLERSNRYPNCSYFRNWINAADEIVWPIDVLTTGDYQASVYYCLRPQDVGAKLELRCGDAAVTAVVTEPNDPPPVGAAEDRFPRMESLVRAFKPLDLGVLSLKQGAAELRLKSLEIPGEQSIEFRLLVLTRVEE